MFFSNAVDGYNLSPFCSIYTVENKQNLPKYKPVSEKIISSGSVDISFLGFLEAAAVAMFVVISEARVGLHKNVFC